LDALLQVRQLRKLYGEQVALLDVAFDVHEGEVLGVIGPNGSGKTTGVWSKADSVVYVDDFTVRQPQ
jgi:ABC-type branched-subunit amino acid transport system ATPase component